MRVLLGPLQWIHMFRMRHELLFFMSSLPAKVTSRRPLGSTLYGLPSLSS